MEAKATCPKCKQDMERGFLSTVSWWRGSPQEARDTKAFFGPKLRTEVYEVVTYRCPECGYLESRTASVIGRPGDSLGFAAGVP